MRARLQPVTQLAVIVCFIPFAHAQVLPVSPEPVVGSPNIASADPPVPRPPTTHCSVPLFRNEEFSDSNIKTFTYKPPAACPGPWAKVVFTADFTVSEGRQYDRNAAFYLGHANIYYGTTAEPSANVSPSWHVERDVTDLSAIFKTAQSGEANIGNFVGVHGGVTYNGIIYANASLDFYKASPSAPAATVPDIVVPLPDSDGGAVPVNTSADQLTQTVQLPRNVERLYLDVIAQSQSRDEFWYFCAPNQLAKKLFTCGNTAFREVEVTLDGQPAGVAPVYPWIFSGGIDPDLWRPIPAVQTLSFKPYRVDLSPFAGLLSDGAEHTVALRVFNANRYFFAAANLLVFTDHNSKANSGGILSNTLSEEPVPAVKENVVTASNEDVKGDVTITAKRTYEITGFLNTSHGRVETSVSGDVSFRNLQRYSINSVTYRQDVTQLTNVSQKTTVRSPFMIQQTERYFEFPLTVSYLQGANADGTLFVTTNVDQAHNARRIEGRNNSTIFAESAENHVISSDTVNLDAAGKFLSNTGRASWQEVKASDSMGGCFDKIIQASAGLVSAAGNGSSCFLL
ncbi:MAG TPA: peptide-N4-asparagine amidase [Bryobacteraceae bacterium]|nr:peptide-N4-asparagine amidase [Bryobacteraceae bacterium]